MSRGVGLGFSAFRAYQANDSKATCSKIVRVNLERASTRAVPDLEDDDPARVVVAQLAVGG